MPTAGPARDFGPGSVVVVVLVVVVVVVVVVGTAAATLMERLAWATDPTLSTTSTVKSDVPFATGVPLIVPVDEVRVRPEGREPAPSDQEYPWLPAAADNTVEYAVPAVAPGSAVVATCSTGRPVALSKAAPS